MKKLTNLDIYKFTLSLILNYKKEQDNKDQKQLEDIKDNFIKEIEKQDKRIERFKLELEQPELFKQLSPKEYGQKLLLRKRK